jgi:hypothetical protein
MTEAMKLAKRMAKRNMLKKTEANKALVRQWSIALRGQLAVKSS